MRVDIPVGLLSVQNQSPVLTEEDCASGLVIEVSVDFNKIGADKLLHGYP